jgi:hypothetical protein
LKTREKEIIRPVATVTKVKVLVLPDRRIRVSMTADEVGITEATVLKI